MLENCLRPPHWKLNVETWFHHWALCCECWNLIQSLSIMLWMCIALQPHLPQPSASPPTGSKSYLDQMDPLLGPRTLSLLQHLLRLLLQMHISLVANIEALEAQYGRPDDHFPTATPILLPHHATSSHLATVHPLPQWINRNPRATKRSLSPPLIEPPPGKRRATTHPRAATTTNPPEPKSPVPPRRRPAPVSPNSDDTSSAPPEAAPSRPSPATEPPRPGPEPISNPPDTRPGLQMKTPFWHPWPSWATIAHWQILRLHPAAPTDPGPPTPHP